MKAKELAEFEDKYGYKPLAIPVAMDALSVYVNKANPIAGLTISQVDAIFHQPDNVVIRQIFLPGLMWV